MNLLPEANNVAVKHTFCEMFPDEGSSLHEEHSHSTTLRQAASEVTKQTFMSGIIHKTTPSKNRK